MGLSVNNFNFNVSMSLSALKFYQPVPTNLSRPSTIQLEKRDWRINSIIFADAINKFLVVFIFPPTEVYLDESFTDH
jgi:hypothetical protein